MIALVSGARSFEAIAELSGQEFNLKLITFPDIYFYSKTEKLSVMAIHSKSRKSGVDSYFGQKKLAEKLRKSRQSKNREKSA